MAIYFVQRNLNCNMSEEQNIKREKREKIVTNILPQNLKRIKKKYENCF